MYVVHAYQSWDTMETFVVLKMFFVSCLLSLVCVTCASNLPGSCIAAGYTSCCSTNSGSSCHGQPATCFCDPSCREYQDCCADLDQICSPNLVPSEVLSSVKPVFLFATYTTFHSATLQWAASAPNFTLPGVNITYVVKYHQLSDINDTLSEEKLVTVTMENNSTTEYYIGDGLYGVILTRLIPNTTYSCKVEVTVTGSPTSLGTNTVSFTTLEYPSVQELRINLHNATSVRLSWDPLELPLGVQLSHYTLYYGFDGLELSREFGVHDTCGIIGGLHVHQEYHFSITGTVVDVDGSVSESVRSRFIPVFVPDAVLFQLRGEQILSCSSWNADLEQHLVNLFRGETARAIRRQCKCPFPDAYIKEPMLLCQSVGFANSQQSSSLVTFRASVLSTINITSETILIFLEEWVSTAATIGSGLVSDTIELDSSCSTRLRLKSDPLCSSTECGIGGNTNFQQSSNNNNVTTADMCITVPIFISALVAELLFLLSVMMCCVVLAIVKLTSKKKSVTMDYEMSSTSRQIEGNIYDIDRTTTTMATNTISTLAPSTAVTETLPPTTLQESSLPTTLPESSSPVIVPESSSPATMPESSLPTTMPESSPPTTMPDSSPPATMPESSLPTTMPESSPPATMPESSPPTTMLESSLPIIAPESSLPTTMQENSPPITVSGSSSNTAAHAEDTNSMTD